MVDKVLFEKVGKVGIIRLHRPEVLNCLDPETLRQFKGYLERIRGEKQIQVIMICGNGRAFCTGMDLKYAKGKSPQEISEINHCGLVETFAYLQRFPKPTIAVIQGYALGGGFELALSCDFRVASKEQAIFGFPEIDLGILPTWGGLFLPIWIVGYSQTMELVLSGKKIDAPTAYTMGLVTKLVAHDQLFEEALAFAKELARKGAFQLQLAKYIIQHSITPDQKERLRLSTLAMELITAGPEGENRLNSLLAAEEKQKD